LFDTSASTKLTSSLALPDLEILTAQLCGARLDAVRIARRQITLVVTGRQGQVLLHCQGAEVFNAPEEYRDLARRPGWARQIEWVGILADGVLSLALTTGFNLFVRTDQVHLEGDGRWELGVGDCDDCEVESSL
jgi:hypothetical protein